MGVAVCNGQLSRRISMLLGFYAKFKESQLLFPSLKMGVGN